MSYIDLHTHTTFSDAVVTLEQTLTQAQNLGLSLLSITDHDTVESYYHLASARHLFAGKILPGVELSAAFDGGFVEILGYGIDFEKMDKEIKANYPTRYDSHVLESRIETETLLEKGVVLDRDFVKRLVETPEAFYNPHHQSCRDALLAELKRHPENARFFGSRKEFETLNHKRFSRNYLYNVESTLFCDLSPLCPTVKKVVEIISKCGGFSFLAHLYVYSEDVHTQLDKIVALGIDGVECSYGTFTPEQGQFLRDFCDKNGLLKSGGSDHHGIAMRPGNPLGISMGEPISFDLIKPWFSRVEASLL